MTKFSVKNRAKLMNLGIVGNTRGYNSLPLKRKSLNSLRVKNRVKLMNSRIVGSTRGFNNLPLQTNNSNNENPMNISGSNSPMSIASNVGSLDGGARRRTRKNRKSRKNRK
jgi:hypothetical protein